MRVAVYVDGGPVLGMTIRVLLEQAGYTVRLAETGIYATQLRFSERPSIIVSRLNWVFSKSGGWQLISALRKLFAGTPILTLSGKLGNEERNAVLKAGTTCHTSIPIAGESLVRQVTDFVNSERCRQNDKFEDVRIGEKATIYDPNSGSIKLDAVHQLEFTAPSPTSRSRTHNFSKQRRDSTLTRCRRVFHGVGLLLQFWHDPLERTQVVS